MMRKIFVLMTIILLVCFTSVLAADNTAAPVTDAKKTPIVKPILKLKVDVITVNNAEYIAESNIKNAANVIFTAQLGNAGFSNDVANAKPVVIDFYTGNPLLDVYPNQYLGSAKMNKNGIAQLKVYQKPGEYAGGAIWAKTPWGKIFSNIVMYKVPPIPVKPELKLEVFVKETLPLQNNTTDVRPKNNVTYKATLINNTTSAAASPIDTNAMIQSRRVYFYTGSENSKFPNKYIGSAELDRSGIAKISIYQAPGKYAGGAVYVITNTGEKIRSNVVFYEVKALQENAVTPDPNIKQPVSDEKPVQTNISSNVKLSAPIKTKATTGVRANVKTGANVKAKANVDSKLTVRPAPQVKSTVSNKSAINLK